MELQMTNKTGVCKHVNRWDLVTVGGRKAVGSVTEFTEQDGELVKGFHVNIAGEHFVVPRTGTRLDAITLTKTPINAYVQTM